MAKQWYIVHTFSGYEQKAKAALEERVRAMGKQDFFGEILVPVEKVVELVKGKKKTSSRGRKSSSPTPSKSVGPIR